MSNIKLYPDTDLKGTPISFDPTNNAALFYTGKEYVSTNTNPPTQTTEWSDPIKKSIQPFSVKSIENNTDYFVVLTSMSEQPALECVFGSSNDTKITQSLNFVRAIKKPPNQCETKNTDNTDKNTTTYKITMIVFIVLFSFMFIGSLILYFTGMMKFHFSSVSFGHGAHY